MNLVDMNTLKNILRILLEVAALIVATRLLMILGSNYIEKFLQRYRIKGISLPERKINTLRVLLRSLLRYSLYFIVITATLSLFKININSIIALAGIGGLAIGFGAQSLVKDVINGFFILFEDQYGVGDYVTIGEHSGIVEEIGLRSTKLKDFNGDVHIIPNSDVVRVTNHSRNPHLAVVDVRIGYDENIQKIAKLLEGLCEEIRKEGKEVLIEGPEFLGITEFSDFYMVMRIIAKTKPLEHWAFERELRKRIKILFDTNNIKIPYERIIINKTS